MIVPRSLLLKSLMTDCHSETINRRCELVVLHSAELSFLERQNWTLLTRMTLLMILMSWMQALRHPVSRLSATVFRRVTSCSARDGATHVHSDIPRCISQELDVSSATFARLVRRKEGCRFIVAKVRMQTVIGSEWSSAAVMSTNIATVSSSMKPQS